MKTLETLEREYNEALKNPSRFFKGEEEASRYIKEKRKECHPDKWEDSLKKKASEIFSLWGDLWEKVKDDIHSGYITLLNYEGTFSRTRVLKDKNELTFKVKTPLNKSTSLSKLLKEEHTFCSGKFPQNLRLMIPQAIESPNNIEGFCYEYFFGNVLFPDVTKIYEFDFDHFLWVFRRGILFLDLMQKLSLVHTALTPDHLSIVPVNHGLFVLGWAHRHELDTSIKFVDKKYLSWYEGFTGKMKKANHSLDAALFYRSLISLLGQDPLKNSFGETFLPKKVQRALKGHLQVSLLNRSLSFKEIHAETEVWIDEYCTRGIFKHLRKK